MIKADNQAIDFVMRIINQVIENEYADLSDIDDGQLMNIRLELWRCFLDQYQVKRTPKSGILVVEII